MNKEFAWELFKNTGNIEAYMLMKDVEMEEATLMEKENASRVRGEVDGTYQNERDCNKNC